MRRSTSCCIADPGSRRKTTQRPHPRRLSRGRRLRDTRRQVFAMAEHRPSKTGVNPLLAPAIPARNALAIGIAGSSPAMTSPRRNNAGSVTYRGASRFGDKPPFRFDCQTAKGVRPHCRDARSARKMHLAPSTSRGRAERRMPDASAASRAMKKAHERSHHGCAGHIRRSARNGLNGLLRENPR